MAGKKNVAKQPEIIGELDRWIFYGFLAVVIMVPLAMSRITFDQFDIAKVLSIRVLTFLMFGLWAWKMIVARKREIRWSNLDFLVAGFLFLVFLSTMTSIHLPTAIHGKFKRYEGFLTFFNYAILYFLGMQTFTSMGRLSTLSKTLSFSGGLVALYGVMQYVGLDPLPWATLPFEERRSFSTFGNPDLLAGFLVIILPIAIAEFIKARDVLSKSLTGASLFFILVALLTAFTRGAWIGAAVSLVVFALFGARAILANPKKLMVIIAAFVGVFALIAVYSASTGHDVLNLVERLKSATRITEGSAGARLEIWKAGFGMIKESPILGLGPDTFRLGSERHETQEYAKLNQGKTVADNAHNYVIQLAAGIGIPATVLFIVFLGWVAFIAFRHSRILEGDDRLTIAGLSAALVGYFVHLLFGVSVTGGTGVFWIVIIALVAMTPAVKTLTVNKSSDYVLKGAMAVAGIVVVVSAYYAMAMYYADYSYASAIELSNQGSQLATSGDTESAIAAFSGAQASYEKAIALYKNGRYFEGYGLYLEQLGNAQQDSATMERAVSVFQASVDWEPLEADHYTFLAATQARLARDSEDPLLDVAVMNLKKAIKNRPYAISAHAMLGNVYYNKRDLKSALKELEFVLEYNPSDPNVNLLSAKLYDELGDEEKAKKQYELVLSVQPDNKEAKDWLNEHSNR